MSKAKSGENASQIESALQLSEQAYLTQTGANGLTVDEMLAKVEEAGDIAFEDATSEYLELKEGQVCNLLFTGLSTMTGENGKEVPVACFTGKENKKFIHGSTVIVGSLRKVTQLPALVRLTHQGMVKGGGGNKYADIRVQVLKGATS